MNQIKKAFKGTKVYNDVVVLLETGKATFDMVDLNWGLYRKLISLLKENNVTVTEKQNMFSIYCVDFKIL